MINVGGQFYCKPDVPLFHGKKVEIRFPSLIDIADDLQELGYCTLRPHGERTPQREAKPVTGNKPKPVRETKPDTAPEHAPKPEHKEPVSDGNQKRKIDFFKL